MAQTATSGGPVVAEQAEAMMMMMGVRALRPHILRETKYLHNNKNLFSCIFFLLFISFYFSSMHISFI